MEDSVRYYLEPSQSPFASTFDHYAIIANDDLFDGKMEEMQEARNNYLNMLDEFNKNPPGNRWQGWRHVGYVEEEDPKHVPMGMAQLAALSIEAGHNVQVYDHNAWRADDEEVVEVLKSDKPILVDFWAEWCGPCKQIGPTLEEISNEMSNEITIAKHNIDNEPNTPTKYGVRGIPTMLLFKGGELKATKVGATTKSNIVSWIKENI